MKLHSGLLNQKIGIYNQVNIDYGYGGAISEDVLYWQTSASVEPIRSQRSIQANQEVLKPSYMFTLRNRNDKFLTSGMTVLWRGERWTIVSAEVDFVYKEYIRVTCKAEELPQGTVVTPDPTPTEGSWDDEGTWL